MWEQYIHVVNKDLLQLEWGYGQEKLKTHEYTSAVYDWGITSPRQLDVNIRVNDSILISSSAERPPELQRWNQPMNMASNAFLRYKMNVRMMVTPVSIQNRET